MLLTTYSTFAQSIRKGAADLHYGPSDWTTTNMPYTNSMGSFSEPVTVLVSESK